MRRSVGVSVMSLAAFALPFVASAATLFTVLSQFSQLINIVTYLLIAVAIFWFFWGLIKYIQAEGEEKTKGLLDIVYSVVALFVMVSVWGLIQLLQGTFGVASTAPILPTLPNVTAY